MIIGYARVSTSEQNLQNQIDLLRREGCEKIFSDIASGVREDRKGLKELLTFARRDDVLKVYKSDRIFRSLKNMIDIIDLLNNKGVKFVSITEPAFDTTTANGKFVIQIFGAVAEFERNLISERTKSGLNSAKLRKKNLGRPKGAKKDSLDKYNYVKHLYDSIDMSIDQACKKAGISKSTFYRIDKIKNNERREDN